MLLLKLFSRTFPSLSVLDFSGSPWLCSNETLAQVGAHCPCLRVLNVRRCAGVNDVGVQNLVFPQAVLRRGEVNLANPRIRTNPLSRHLKVKKSTCQSNLLIVFFNCRLLT